MAFTGFSFANAFIVVEAFAVLFLPALDVLILRHGGSTGGVIPGRLRGTTARAVFSICGKTLEIQNLCQDFAKRYFSLVCVCIRLTVRALL